MSYDVSALFTSIPIEPAIRITRKHLEDDPTLNSRTSMTVDHSICLLELYMKNTYFSYQGRFYEQTEGAAMGSPISPLISNLFMEDFESQAIRTSTAPPTLWKRYVDDTFAIIKKNNKDSLLEHLNFINPNIRFTCEEVRKDGSMPFLDILITPEEDSSLKNISVHPAATLFQRANTICSTPQLLQEEEEDLFKALTRCKYPTRAIKRAKLKSQNQNIRRTRRTQTGQNTNQNNWYMVVPYHQGLSERIKRTCNKFGVQEHLKGGQTIKKASLWLQRTRILSQAKVESFTDTNAVNMGVMKNILVNLLEILQTDSKNTKSPLPSFLTITTSQVITSTSPILA